MNNSKKFAIGAAVAAAAGYIAGILTAPKSGKETRKDVQNAAMKVKTEAEKKLKLLHSELSDLLKQVKASGEKLQKGASKELDTIVKRAQDAKEKARDILSALHDDDANDDDLNKAIKEVKQSIEHLKSYMNKHKLDAK